MKKIINGLMAKSEQESWVEKTEVCFVILYPRTTETKYGKHQEWFRLRIIEQSKVHPHGITEDTALKLAGKTGKVWKEVSKTLRLK